MILSKCGLVSAVVVGLGVLNSSTAHAADPIGDMVDAGWYASVFGGGTFLQDYTVSNASFGGIVNTLETDPGFIVGGIVGAEFIQGWRGEIEVSYWEVDPNSWTNTGFVGSGLSGHVSAVNILANVWYDIQFDSAFQPYLGGGIGLGVVDGKLTTSNGLGQQFDGTDTGLAFQLGGGLKFNASPMVDIDVGYRFRGILDVDFDQGPGFDEPWGADDIYVHMIQGGIAFKIGAP